MKILIIGAGPTAALLACNLKRSLLKEALDIHVWEKSTAIGGRFQTFVSPDGPENTSNTADLGAQYLTQSQNLPWSKPYFDELENAGLLKKLHTDSLPGFRQDDTKSNFVCTQGTGSIVKYYFEQAMELKKIQTNQKVTELSVNCDQSNTVDVSTETGVTEAFDVVVSAIPVPEFLLFNKIEQFINDKPDLTKVSFTTRFALGIFFQDKLSLDCSNQPLNFVNKPHSPLRYWSIENLKRSAGDYTSANTQFSAITVHTSIGYGANNLEREPESVVDYLEGQVQQETELLNMSAYSVICHKWKYSQVSSSYTNSPGYVVFNQAPIILGAGDSYSFSGFEGCINSVENTVKYLESILL